MSAWLIFLLSAGAVVAAGSRLSRDGDVIAERTGLGGAWVGAILVAGATSLPELATDIFAVRLGTPGLAIGDLFGSSMANMLILAVADLSTRNVQVLTRVAINQVMVGLIAILLTALAVAGIAAHLGFAVLGVGWSVWLVGGTYVLGMRLLHVNRAAGPPFESGAGAEREEPAPDGAALRTACVGFAVSALVILAAAPHLAASAGDLARQMGISTGFVGLLLLAITTSLPEASVTAASVRSGSYDLAIGNLMGSNCFNMAILFVLDLVDGPGPLLSGVQPGLAVGGLVAIVMMGQALIAILNRSERRVWYLEPDAGFLVITYLAGLYLVYRVGH